MTERLARQALLRTLCAAGALIFLTARAPAVETVEESFDETYALNSGAPISIRNIDGSIRIYAADVTEVHLHATKKAYTAERLKAINVDAKATATALDIDTQMPPRQPGWSTADRSGTVDYTLIVPMTARIVACDLVNGEILVEGLQDGSVKAHLVNGWLAGHNCFADLNLSNVNGRVDVSYDWWQAERKFTASASSVNGTVRALIPPDASAAITAASEHGHVANNFDEGEPQNSANSNVAIAVGSGESASINLHATNGNVRIDKTYDNSPTK